MSVPIKYIIYIERERVRKRNCSPLQPWAARSSVNAYQTTNETHALEASRVYMLREKERERAREPERESERESERERALLGTFREQSFVQMIVLGT